MNQPLEKKLEQKVNNKTKPPGALGKLENLAIKIGTILDTAAPELKDPVMMVFAADHGISDAGVSPYPKEVTWQMVANFLSGGAAINVFCRQNNIALKVVDAGVDHDFEDNELLISAKIARGTRNMLEQPAMTKDECEAALSKGRELVSVEREKGCNIIGFGEMGIGNTSSAALLMSKYCDLPVEDCVGKGTGLDEAGLSNKIKILKQVLEFHADVRGEKDILATFGGLEIAMMAGAMIQAYENNMVIMVDGFISTAALLAARALCPHVVSNCIYCHQSDEKGHAAMLQHLNADPLLNLNMRLGEGTGAALAFPLIKSAVSFLNEMASFDDAGVTNKA